MILFLLVLLLGFFECISSECALDYIRVENERSSSGLLSWQGGPCEPGSVLEVRHLLWLACPKDLPSHIPPVTILYEEEGSSSLLLGGLVPFSLYEVSFGGREARFRTTSDVPDVRPNFLAIRPGKQSFHLEWRRGKKEDCMHQNGVLSGYRVELWGLSPWVLNGSRPLQTVNVGDNIYEYYFHELLPYTTYSLRVYAVNQGIKEVNPGVYLKIKNTTLPTRPEPPSALRIKPLNRSVFLEWDPEYPPSGEVEFYHIILRETETKVIKKGYYVHKIDDRHTCPGSDSSECWVISYKDIAFDVHYSLTIRTKNVGVKELSQDSQGFEFLIPPESSDPADFVPQESQLKPPHEDKSEDFHFYHSITLIVLAVLGAAITVLLVIIIALVFKIKRDRLESSAYDSHKLSAHYRRGSGSTHVTSIGYGHSYVDRVNDIQSRCLPEPPSNIKTPVLKDPPEYSEFVEEDESDEHYLSPSDKPASVADLDVGGYLTPSFVRKAEPSSKRCASMGQLASEKIQMKSYDRVWQPSKENPSSCNYIDLENVIHQSVEDLIRSKTSSVV